MLLIESMMKIRRQILLDGRSIRSVARETGLSGITIHKYLADEEVPRDRRQTLITQHRLEP